MTTVSAISYVCISLEGAHERRALMAQQFEKVGIDATFFTGIEPRGATETIPGYDLPVRMRRYGRPLARGEIGCYLSHREVWKSLVYSSDDVWCVMEDDLILRSGFRDAVEELTRYREYWDVVRLMGLLNRPQLPYAELPSGTRLMWMDQSPNGTQCYVITREAAEKMLKYSERMLHAIDTTIDRCWENKLRLFKTSTEFVEDANLESMLGFRPGITNLSMRVREKIYRRMDKIVAAHYNAKHRPRQLIRVSSDGRPD
jgi:glycosyl transferase family 25